MTDREQERTQRWIEEDGIEYDPDRWDPAEQPDECQRCGADLQGAGDGWTMSEFCPECRKHVWIR